MRLLIGLVLFGSLCVKDSILLNPLEEFGITISSYIQSKCDKAGGVKLVDDLEEVASHCSRRFSSQSSICAIYDLECELPILEKFKDCLEPEEEDLIPALYRIARGVLDGICENSFSLVTAFQGRESDHCFGRVQDSLSPCVETMKQNFGERGLEGVFLKDNFCIELHTFSSCMKNIVDDKCSDLSDLRSVIDSAIAVANDECAK